MLILEVKERGLLQKALKQEFFNNEGPENNPENKFRTRFEVTTMEDYSLDSRLRHFIPSMKGNSTPLRKEVIKEKRNIVRCYRCKQGEIRWALLRTTKGEYYAKDNDSRYNG